MLLLGAELTIPSKTRCVSHGNPSSGLLSVSMMGITLCALLIPVQGLSWIPTEFWLA